MKRDQGMEKSKLKHDSKHTLYKIFREMTHFQIWFLIPPLIETFINVQVDRDLFSIITDAFHIHMKEEQGKILKCIILEKLMCVFFF